MKITGKALCREDHGGRGASEARTLALGGEDLREPRSWEDRGGRAEGAFAPFSIPPFPAVVVGFFMPLFI